MTNEQRIYCRLYSQLIKKAKNRLKPSCYTEKHHIIPKCLGGSNCRGNLVVLKAKEHYFVHKWLTKIFSNNSKIWFAWICMAFIEKGSKRYKCSIKDFELARIKNRELLKGNQNALGTKQTKEFRKGVAKRLKKYWDDISEEELKERNKKISEGIKGNKNAEGTTHTEEWRQDMSERNSGENNPMFGVSLKHTEEWKGKKSIDAKLYWSNMSEEEKKERNEFLGTCRDRARELRKLK